MMFREAIGEFSDVLGYLVTIVATGGTAAMVFVSVSRQLNLTGVEFWRALSVVVAAGLLLGFGITIVRIDNQFDQLPFDVGLYVIAGNAFLSEEQSKQDKTHRIEQLRQHVDLTNGGNDVVFTERYKGRNISETTSSGFHFYFNSETYIRDNEVKVKQILDGDEFTRDLVADAYDEFSGIYSIDFVEPIPKGEQFELEVKSHLGRWDLSDGKYLFTDCNRFIHGIGELKYSVELDTKPTNYAGYRAISHAEMTHHRDPQKLNFELEEVEVEKDSSGLEYWIRDREVRDSVYILEFQW